MWRWWTHLDFCECGFLVWNLWKRRSQNLVYRRGFQRPSTKQACSIWIRMHSNRLFFVFLSCWLKNEFLCSIDAITLWICHVSCVHESMDWRTRVTTFTVWILWTIDEPSAGAKRFDSRGLLIMIINTNSFFRFQFNTSSFHIRFPLNKWIKK